MKSIFRYLRHIAFEKKYYLIEPLKIIYYNKADFSLWIIFTVIAGQLGIIANVLVSVYTNKTDLSQAFLNEFNNSSFYTFSIALVASLMGPIFINIKTNPEAHFRTLKTFILTFFIFYLIVVSIIYAAIQSKLKINTPVNILWQEHTTQIFFFIMALILSIYGYCITNLESYDNVNANNVNDAPYNRQNDENVNNIIINENNVNEDNGIAL